MIELNPTMLLLIINLVIVAFSFGVLTQKVNSIEKRLKRMEGLKNGN